LMNLFSYCYSKNKPRPARSSKFVSKLPGDFLKKILIKW
jgi:hypothetical protein